MPRGIAIHDADAGSSIGIVELILLMSIVLDAGRKTTCLIGLHGEGIMICHGYGSDESTSLSRVRRRLESIIVEARLRLLWQCG